MRTLQPVPHTGTLCCVNICHQLFFALKERGLIIIKLHSLNSKFLNSYTSLHHPSTVMGHGRGRVVSPFLHHGKLYDVGLSARTDRQGVADEPWIGLLEQTHGHTLFAGKSSEVGNGGLHLVRFGRKGGVEVGSTKHEAVAAVVAFPIGYACMKPWLEQYAVQTEISWWIYVGIFLLVALLVALCIGWRVWKTATARPADEICKG